MVAATRLLVGQHTFHDRRSLGQEIVISGYGQHHASDLLLALASGQGTDTFSRFRESLGQKQLVHLQQE
jgi:hypothetical protein